MKSLTSKTVHRERLTPQDRQTMHAIFAEYFEGTTREQFEADLSNKDWVILLLDSKTGSIQGFSTLAIYSTSFRQTPISVVYSGDTIIRDDYWGSPELPRAWIRTVIEKSSHLPQPLYWLLISSGYKTYRFLSLFYRDFFPRHDRPTSQDVQDLIDFLAAERFGDAYDRATGVVRFKKGATPLRSGVAEIGTERLKDPHVAYFERRNPGHRHGDELVCLARVHPDNFTPAGKRMTR